MNIIAITTSVDYADHLVWLLRTLRNWVQGVVVVTERGDASVEVCRMTNATPVLFDGWRERGATFNRCGAIRHAQQLVHEAYPDSWYLIVDADIMLLENAPKVIAAHATDESAIYCARRAEFHTVDDLVRGVPNKTYGCIGAGYFQLYKQHLLYPEWSATAEGGDLLFAKQFPSLRMLPLTVGHCGREGVNWGGRCSPLWQLTAEQAQQVFGTQ